MKNFIFLVVLALFMFFSLQEVLAQTVLDPPPPEERHEAIVTKIAALFSSRNYRELV